MIHNSDHYVVASDSRDLKDNTPLTSLNATMKILVKDKTGSTSFAEVPMNYVSSGEWDYTIPGTAFVEGSDPWTVEVRIYDVTGNTLHRVSKVQENDGY